MIIDSDAHVMECQDTWDYLAKSEQAFMPAAVTTNDGKKYWCIEGQLFPRDAGDGDMALDIRNFIDIPGRLALMDSYSVDVQVLYPTIFQKSQVSNDAKIATALYRCYNRWMADRCAQSGGRLHWVMLPPVLDMDATVAEIKWAKANGACGIFLRGMEGDRFIDDPSFDPLYRAAVEADLAICVHAGSSNMTMKHLAYPKDLFLFVVMPVVASFRRALTTPLMANYRDLRIGFLQAGAEWVSYLVDDVARSVVKEGKPAISVEELLEEERLFVACRTDDDIERLFSFGFSRSLLIGTDFAHKDASTELDAPLTISSRKDTLGLENALAIVDHNPRTFYGISSSVLTTAK